MDLPLGLLETRFYVLTFPDVRRDPRKKTEEEGLSQHYERAQTLPDRDPRGRRITYSEEETNEERKKAK